MAIENRGIEQGRRWRCGAMRRRLRGSRIWPRGRRTSVLLAVTIATAGLVAACDDGDAQRSGSGTRGNVLYVNGKPLIPTGVYFWPDLSHPIGRNPFADVAAYGFDALVAYYQYVRPDRTVQNQPDIHDLRRECDRLGIYYFVGAPGVSDLMDKSDEQLQALFACTTDAVAGSPHFVGWMFDEPIWNGVDLALMERAAAAIRAHAARPLVWINFAPVNERWDEPDWPDMEAYARIGDIVGFDFYPVDTGLPWTDYISRSRIEDFAWFVDVARGWVGPDKPVWMIQQGYRPSDFDQPPAAVGRRPDRIETRFMSFQALVHGATGLFYFPGSLLFGPIPADDPTWNVYIRETVAAIQGLRGALASTEPAESVHVSTPEVRTLVRRRQGKTVIVAVREIASDVRDVTITLGRTRTGPFAVDGEHRRVTVQEGAFSDRFEPYAVHVYVAE